MDKKGVLKKIVNVVIIFLKIFSLVVTLVFPFLHNSLDHIIAQWIFYCSITVFIACVLITNTNHNVYNFFYNLLLLFIFVSCFIINYYNTSYNWYWFVFVLITIIILFGGNMTKLSILKKKKYTEEQNKNLKTIITKYTLFYLLVDLFYMSWFLDNLICKFIFGGLVMVIVFYNLGIVFLSGNSTCKFMLIHDLVIGLLLTVYLIYIIPSKDIKEIVIPLVSSIYGGILTLVGVAWTIKKADFDRKEEKRNAVKPYLYLISQGCKCKNEGHFEVIFTENKTRIPDKINLFFSIKNTDKGIFIVKEAIVNEFSFKPVPEVIIEKNYVAKVLINIENINDIEYFYILGTDVLGNAIKYKLILNKEKNGIESLVEEE